MNASSEREILFFILFLWGGVGRGGLMIAAILHYNKTAS